MKSNLAFVVALVIESKVLFYLVANTDVDEICTVTARTNTSQGSSFLRVYYVKGDICSPPIKKFLCFSQIIMFIIFSIIFLALKPCKGVFAVMAALFCASNANCLASNHPSTFKCVCPPGKTGTPYNMWNSFVPSGCF